MDFVKLVGGDFESGKQLPKFAPGDTIVVDCRTRKGSKKRIQKFRDMVIRTSGHGDQRHFTARKISNGINMECIFPYNSPFTEETHVECHGKVRRTKPYYLRNLRSKTARIRERRTLSANVEQQSRQFRLMKKGISVDEPRCLFNLVLRASTDLFRRDMGKGWFARLERLKTID